MQAVAEKILVAVREPVKVRGEQLVLQASCGIALYPDHGDSQAAIEERADKAMYSSKYAGAPLAHTAMS